MIDHNGPALLAAGAVLAGATRNEILRGLGIIVFSAGVIWLGISVARYWLDI